ncbi:CDP-diacylglycerol--glycerol-3-phosphate 3-phosphatidyltransferase [Candidatus Thioglobus autotrophicus]|jgi:CDP-diacylglycerol---glycerol-3-phosphate 3-phosphatidyltransferase|uniref:CDP-diacylglycerol--glycerol-3-phosphate 3-phosphatidyltransferase n=1 Tax=Candidatus Thioglobus autotrophicus TaxID=1705394 RepID=A0A0M5LEL6_9GAMM|nr:CDP-diacylglycerol--glycerol-3-phosphate 3-phosphatidyltransferase [Candidatus Thioglobus autotrophicus]ALE52648.1 CDP-diacylglycerol--glycerol-3-phosphate 3-phosphatidyltransferase [Candidatus Thioglobus autotrophicus]WPE18233.1 CDP-diacylglycerol--glycerol-3-phosphate 3-phosphatidyltransferase [Candidatus Thioglobus autotrophicus]
MMTIPNLITLSRIFLIPVFVALYYFQPAYTQTPVFTWINFCLTGAYAFISITDYLDGYLARKLNMTSQLGAFLDPVADKLMVSVALIMLVDFYPSGTHWYITIAALIIISREILVSALREWMGTIGQRSTVNVSYIGKVKTFVQIFAILFLLYQQPFFGLPSFEIGVVLLMAATLLTLWSGFIYLKEGVKTFDN